jgi:tripartite-type tricarboxylate transporter receptor subunit TctC
MKNILLIIGMLLAFSLQAKDSVHLVVPFAPGGSTDKIARVLVKHLPDLEVTVDYRPGAGSVTGTNYVASVKDGTVLLVVSTATVIAPLRKDSVATYNIEKDFIPVGIVGVEPTIIVVKNDGKINDFNDFAQLAAKVPLTFSTVGVGTLSHFSGILLNEQLKGSMRFIHVPYRGSSFSTLAVLSGEVIWTAESQVSISEFVTSKKLKPIAVVSNKRVKEYPEVPTLIELGINDSGFYRWHAIAANATADEKIVSYVRDKMNSEGFRSEVSTLGIDVNSNLQVTNFFKNETSKTSRILKDIQQ